MWKNKNAVNKMCCIYSVSPIGRSCSSGGEACFLVSSIKKVDLVKSLYLKVHVVTSASCSGHEKKSN